MGIDGSARPVPGGSLVLDAKSGARRPADRAALAAILQRDEVIRGDSIPKYIWVSAGAKSVRTTLNVNGERIAKVEWSSKVGTVEHVEVVRRLGECILLAPSPSTSCKTADVPVARQILVPWWHTQVTDKHSFTLCHILSISTR